MTRRDRSQCPTSDLSVTQTLARARSCKPKNEERQQMLKKGYTKATDTEDKISESVLSCDFGKENYLACRLLAWGLEA
jgi:hypothetical protein